MSRQTSDLQTGVSNDQRTSETVPTPPDGDVVVAPAASASRKGYSVSQVPGAPQVSTPTWDEALRLARNFASTNRVDVWYSENGIHRILEVYRSRTATAVQAPDAEKAAERS